MTDAQPEVAERWRCPMCSALNEASAQRCSICAVRRDGTSPEPADTRPLNRRARIAIWLALAPFAINLASNLVNRGLQTLVDRNPSMHGVVELGSLLLFLVTRVGIIALMTIAVILAVRAWRETAPTAATRGRGRLIAVFILAGLQFIALVFTTFSFALLG